MVIMLGRIHSVIIQPVRSAKWHLPTISSAICRGIRQPTTTCRDGPNTSISILSLSQTLRLKQSNGILTLSAESPLAYITRQARSYLHLFRMSKTNIELLMKHGSGCLSFLLHKSIRISQATLINHLVTNTAEISYELDFHFTCCKHLHQHEFFFITPGALKKLLHFAF